MADNQGTELLMQMIDSNGKALEAESQITLSGETDTLIKGFTNGCFFSVDEFAFGMNIDDQDATSDAANTGGGQGVGTPPKRASAPRVKFGKWKTASPEEVAKMAAFPVRMDEFSVTRSFDRASPVLFQSCARSATFNSVSLVKRKIIGGAQLQTFLRIDFTGVLVTHVGWDDAEVIKETLRFVFRGVTVQYCRQAHDGTLAPAGSVDWSFKAALRKPPGSGG
jgi:type VI protein secretion system component Hcp